MNREGIRGLLDKCIEIGLWCWYGVADKIRLWLTRRKIVSTNNLVSIIMPTIGRDATKAIQSVLNQTYKNWELIVVGDDCIPFYQGCYDDRIKRWTISKKLHYPNEPIYHWLVGPVNAINFGLSKVRGAWIARIDDDDEWLPDHLEKALKFAQEEEQEFVSFDITINWNTTQPYTYYRKTFGAVQTWLYRSYLKCFRCSKHSWRWRPGNNDIDLPKRMARAGVTVMYCPELHANIEKEEDATR